MGLSEVAIYGGHDQTIKADYINPLNFFQANQYGKGVWINGFWAVDLFWKPKKNITFFNQFFIDDFDVKKENRAIYPDRLAFTSKLTLTDLFLPGAQFYSVYNRDENWTYISFKSWENYLFQQKSMGFPKNSVESVKFGFDYFGRPPFIFNFQTGYERHGDQDLTGAFLATKGRFPMGVVQYLFYNDLSVTYMPSTNYYAILNTHWESYKNAGHIDSESFVDFSVFLRLYATINWNFVF